MNKSSFVLLVAALICLGLWIGCESSTPTTPAKTAEKAKPAPEPITPYTGREAFQRLYVAARLWNPDARPYRLESIATSDNAGHDGKALIWRAGFASPGHQKIKAFTWSGSHAEGAPEPGTSSNVEDVYNPTNSSTLVFDMIYLKADSSDAFKVAEQHGGQKLTAKDPKQPVFYVLDWNPTESAVFWHVIYGSSRAEAKLAVEVNGTTGLFVRVEK